MAEMLLEMASPLSFAELPSWFPEDHPRQGRTLSRGDLIQLTVASVDQDSLTLDANHPLAGRELHFEVELLEIQ